MIRSVRSITINYYDDRKGREERTLGDVIARRLNELGSPYVIAIVPRLVRNFSPGTMEVDEASVLIEERNT